MSFWNFLAEQNNWFLAECEEVVLWCSTEQNRTSTVLCLVVAPTTTTTTIVLVAVGQSFSHHVAIIDDDAVGMFLSSNV